MTRFICALALAYALAPSSAIAATDNCGIVLNNLNIMQTNSNTAIAAADKQKKYSSARKLAVLTAARAQGYYAATLVLLPLACKDDALKTLTDQLNAEIVKMNDYTQKNW